MEFAIGGKLALGLWATPRATADADVNVVAQDTDEDHLRVVDCLFPQAKVTVVRERDSRDGISREEAALLAGTTKEIHAVVSVAVFLPKTDLETFVNQRKKALNVGSDTDYLLDANMTQRI